MSTTKLFRLENVQLLPVDLSASFDIFTLKSSLFPPSSFPQHHLSRHALSPTSRSCPSALGRAECATRAPGQPGRKEQCATWGSNFCSPGFSPLFEGPYVKPELLHIVNIPLGLLSLVGSLHRPQCGQSCMESFKNLAQNYHI